MNNKYVKLHSLLRMLGALLAIIVFISMFATKMVVHEEYPMSSMTSIMVPSSVVICAKATSLVSSVTYSSYSEDSQV